MNKDLLKYNMKLREYVECDDKEAISFFERQGWVRGEACGNGHNYYPPGTDMEEASKHWDNPEYR